MSQAPHTTARPVLTHTLGFPRMGARRALKFALESHWRGDSTAADLQATAAELRQQHWQIQADAGLGFVTVGDFALYDHVANHIQLLGCEPARFAFGTAYRPRPSTRTPTAAPVAMRRSTAPASPRWR